MDYLAVCASLICNNNTTKHDVTLSSPGSFFLSSLRTLFGFFFYSTGHENTSALQSLSWHLPNPIQMMNLVIRRSVTPFPKSCWSVMSLWRPLVPYSQWNEDQRRQSPEWLQTATSVWRGGLLLLSRELSGKPTSPVTHGEPVHKREGAKGVGARCADNENQTLDWHDLYWVTPHHEARLHRPSTRSHMLVWNGFTDIWPRPSTRPSTPYSIVLCMTVWSYVFLCLT